MAYNSKEEYIEALKSRGQLPEGFSIATTAIEFFPVEKRSVTPYKMNISLLCLDEPTRAFAGVFTQNKFPGAPVLVGRKMLKQKKAQGVVINNKISNVCAVNGVASAKAVTNAVEEAANLERGVLFPSSTGIIGWQLPTQAMTEAAPKLVQNLSKENAATLAQAIMTTDSFPKLHSVKIGEGSIVAVAKGAGMIEPNLATMLCFIMTDLKISKAALRRCLKKSVAQSFNNISVDSDQSTSDTVLIFSSAKKTLTSLKEFQVGLTKVLKELASDIVRNGEGTTHVIKVNVKGFKNDKVASQVAKAVANSPLVKTAIYGNDPNVGRLVSSVGDFCGNQKINFKKESLQISIAGEVVFKNSAFALDEEKEDRIFNKLKEATLDFSCGFPRHYKNVEIEILAQGKGKAEIYGSDLSYQYIKENAEYRS